MAASNEDSGAAAAAAAVDDAAAGEFPTAESMRAHFGSGGSLLQCQHANPVPEFDERIVFYEYVVLDADNCVVDFAIDHDTGEFSGTLPPGTRVAEHKYFVDGVMQTGSATGFIHSFFEHFNERAQSLRIASGTRMLTDSAYDYYMAGVPDAAAAWCMLRQRDARAEFSALLDAYATGDTELMGFDRRCVAVWRKLFVATVRRSIVRMWDHNRLDGRVMHRSIEMCLNDMFDASDARFRTRELRMFYRFFCDFIVPRKLRRWRTELSMFYQPDRSVPDYLCGQCDGAFVDERGRIYLLDWKRCKKIYKTAFGGKKGRGPCRDVPDCNLQAYNLQINAYWYMLEQTTRWRVAYGAVVCFHPKQSSYELYEVPNYQQLVARILAQYTRDAGGGDQAAAAAAH